MARGRKAFILPAEIVALLGTGKDTVERKSDNKKVEYTFPEINETADDAADVADKVFAAMDVATRIALLNAKLKSTPRNAAANGVDENTRRADELMSIIRKGGEPAKQAKRDLAALLAEMS